MGFLSNNVVHIVLMTSLLKSWESVCYKVELLNVKYTVWQVKWDHSVTHAEALQYPLWCHSSVFFNCRVVIFTTRWCHCSQIPLGQCYFVPSYSSQVHLFSSPSGEIHALVSFLCCVQFSSSALSLVCSRVMSLGFLTQCSRVPQRQYGECLLISCQWASQ